MSGNGIGHNSHNSGENSAADISEHGSRILGADELRPLIARFRAAEQIVKDGRELMRDVKAEAKQAGVDIAAFNFVLKLEKFDPIERSEYFDNIDRYATALRLWAGDDL